MIFILNCHWNHTKFDFGMIPVVIWYEYHTSVFAVQDQLEKFEKRFAIENAEPDDQYQQWLDTYHPKPTCSEKSIKESVAPSDSKTVLIPVPTSSVACEKVLQNMALVQKFHLLKQSHLKEC